MLNFLVALILIALGFILGRLSRRGEIKEIKHSKNFAQQQAIYWINKSVEYEKQLKNGNYLEVEENEI